MSNIKQALLVFNTNIPAGWQEIEYVYFDKSLANYIDTGISPTPSTKVELVCMGMHNDYSHDRLFGVSGLFMIGYSSGGCIFMYNNKEVSGNFNGASVNSNIWVKYVKDGIHNHATLLFDSGNVEIDVPDNIEGSFTTTKTMWVGRANDLSGWAIHNNRVKSLKIWQDGSLVRDMIPITNGTEEALWDNVSKSMFRKQ